MMKKRLQVTVLILLAAFFTSKASPFAYQALSGNHKFLTEQPDTNIYTITEIPAMFPGGDGARIQYLFRNLVYPEISQEQGIQGTVFVSFVVEVDGSITNVGIIRGLSPEIDQEVIRLASEMPRWAPGRIGGKPVRTIFRMPVKFALLGEDDYVRIKEIEKVQDERPFDITRDAVVFVNGKKQTFNLLQLDNKIKASQIESIDYYLDGKGVENFGYPNVVSIKTKKGWKP